MDSFNATILQYVGAMWRRKWIAVSACWAVCVVGWASVVVLPNRYESQARVYVDADTLLTPLLRGLAADTDPARQVDYLQRTLLSRGNLEQLIHLADLDINITSQTDKEALFTSLLESIALKPQTKSLFVISYQDRDPNTAKTVVQSLLTIFAESATGTARNEMDNAQRFLNEQVGAYEKQLRAAEKRRAEFRQQHFEIMSASGGINVDAARQKVAQLRQELQDATVKRDSLKTELASVPSVINVDAATAVIINNGQVTTASERRLEEAQRALDEMKLRFTDKHPDVIAVKAQIAEIKERIASEKKGGGTASPAGGDNPGRKSSVPNTLYEQIKIRLVEADSTVASLQARLKEADSDEKRIEGLVRLTPNLDAELQDLDRDYNILKRNYEELLGRRESTNLAQAADVKADKIQFRIVDPPQVPTKPIAPNRPLLFSAVLIAGVLSGLALPILLAQVDRSFSSINRLRTLGLPVLGSVSYVIYVKDRSRALMQIAGFSASALALVMIYGALLLVSLDLSHLLQRSVV